MYFSAILGALRNITARHNQFSMSLEELKREVPARNDQLDLLDSFISIGNLLDCLVVHGINSGKSFVLKNYFQKSAVPDVIYIDCSAVISLRNFLTKVLKLIITHNGINDESFNYYCDSANRFSVKLEQLIKEHRIRKHHYFVFENFSSLGDVANVFHLIIAFNKIHEVSLIVSQYTTFIFLLNSFNLHYSNNLNELNNYSIPTIFFENYSHDQVFQILTNSITSKYLIQQQCQFPVAGKTLSSDNLNGLDIQQQAFWENFIKLIIDSFYSYTGSNISLVIEIINKIWPIFTKKLFTDDHQYHYQDFLKLYKENQILFKSEAAIRDSLSSKFTDLQTLAESKSLLQVQQAHQLAVDLPIYSKFILCSAYLASFISPKYDFVVFSKLKSLNSRKAYQRKLKAPKKSKKNSVVNSKLLSPGSFELERMLAILHAIYENSGINTTMNQFYSGERHSSAAAATFNSSNTNDDSKLVLNIDFYSQFSNLVSLNLILKTFGYANNANIDLLNPRLKFKINFGFDFIERISKDLNFKIEEYLID